MTIDAAQRLEQLAEEARYKLLDIDTALATARGGWSLPGAPPAASWQETVRSAFQQYDQLVDEYGQVPGVSRELNKHIAAQRRQPEYAEVLNEADAARLWKAGQEHEQEDNACCAYWVYRAAAELDPAPSATRARQRLERMEQDQGLLDAAKTCREIQECHKIYRTAERMLASQPDRARQLFATIVERAPEDSEVHRAARQHVSELLR